MTPMMPALTTTKIEIVVFSILLGLSCQSSGTISTFALSASPGTFAASSNFLDVTSSTTRSSTLFSKILDRNKMTDSTFFKDIWQNKPHLFRRSFTDAATKDMGWNTLLDLLEYSSFRGPETFFAEPPLVLRHSDQVSYEHLEHLYGQDLFACFLDGCSCLQNHADLLSPALAKICLDFEETFPNVYGNTYLTPPNSQAFRPHADDRDVFVLQLWGQKDWKVYERVPIPYPYAPEQVGKNGLDVPPQVLDGPKCIETTLSKGDVLYIPRGWVHEASCSTDDMSFHVTIAVPTFDWTTAGMMAQATQSILHQDPALRQAILPLHVMAPEEQRQHIQTRIDRALETLREQVTVDALINNLGARSERHKERSTALRQDQITQGPERSTPSIDLTTKVQWIEEGAPSSRANEESRLIRPEIREVFGMIEQRLLEQPDNVCTIDELRTLIDDGPKGLNEEMICDLTLLSFARQCIKRGQLKVVE